MTKLFKKSLALLLTLALCLSAMACCFLVSAEGESTPVGSISFVLNDEGDINPGDDVTIDVVANWTGVAGAEFTVTGIPAEAEVKTTNTEVVINHDAAAATVKFVDGNNGELANGVLFSISFTAGKAGDSYTFEIADGSVFCNLAEEDVVVTSEATSFTVVEKTPEGPIEDKNIGVTGSILVSETLGISYVVTGVDAYANFEVVVTKNAYSTVDYNVVASEASIEKKDSTYYKGAYYASIYGFALTDLCLDVVAQVKCYDANGNYVAYSTALPTTIKDLAVALYNSTSAANTKTVLTDLLNVGAEAQAYFAGRYPSSALAQVAEENYPNYGFDQTYATAEVPELTLGAGQTVNNGSTMSGMGTILQSPAIAYVLKPTATPSNLSLEVSFYDAYLKTTKTTTIAAAEMTLYKGSYYYNFSALPLYSSNAILTANLYDGETLLGTHTYTVEQFASENLSNATMGDLLTAIAKFGASARTYFKIA